MGSFRSDMAEELRRQYKDQLDGVLCRKEALHGFNVFVVEIINNNGEKALGKPVGQYYTLDLPKWFDRGSASFSEIVFALSEMIKKCTPDRFNNILVAALGNPDITPDALGSLTAECILVTRHLKDKEPEHFQSFRSVALCRPGVLGTSGIETAAQVAMLCRELEPELVIVVDALAGAEADKLCRSIQVSNSGISPGSGVGNDRKELSRKTLGVPVVSIGMPTVIDAGFFGENSLNGMFVTPRDIDRLVRAGGRLIAYAINLALHKDLTIEDIDSLIG